MEKKWDEMYEQTHQESVTASIQPQPIALVSEKEYEYEYGADAFEAYQQLGKEGTAVVAEEKKPEVKGKSR